MHRFLYKLGDAEYGPTSEYTAWVRSSPAVQEKKAQLEKDLPAFVHNQAKHGEKKGHTKTQSLPVKADPEMEVDLHYAMYRFSLWAEADYEVDQNPSCNYDVTIRPTYHFTDDYNWHEGLQAGGVLPGVAGFEDEWSAALHGAGLAKEFKTHGYWKERTKTYTYPSNWFDLDLPPPSISIKPGMR